MTAVGRSCSYGGDIFLHLPFFLPPRSYLVGHKGRKTKDDVSLLVPGPRRKSCFLSCGSAWSSLMDTTFTPAGYTVLTRRRPMWPTTSVPRRVGALPAGRKKKQKRGKRKEERGAGARRAGGSQEVRRCGTYISYVGNECSNFSLSIR